MKRTVMFFLWGLLVLIPLAVNGEQVGTPVRIGYLQSDIHQLPCWVAMEKGLFEKEGVKVTVAGIFKAGPELMSAFGADALDMGYVGVAPATTAVANKTARVLALAQVNTEGSAIVIEKDNPMQAVSQLAGKTVAVPGHSTVQDALLKMAMSKSGVGPGQIKIMILKPPEMTSALRTKDIDAFVAWEPFPAKAITLGVGRILAKSRDIWVDHPCCVLAADQKFVEQDLDKAKGMVRAHIAAVDYIQLHPDEARKIAEKYTGMDEASIKLAIENVKYTPVLSVDGVKEYVEFLTKAGYIRVSDAGGFVGDFLMPDFIREAFK